MTVASPPRTTTEITDTTAAICGTVARDDLLAALAWAIWSIPGRPVLPVLCGVRITAVAGGWHLSASDLETTSTTTVPGVGAAGDMLLPARQLAAMVSALPKGTDLVLGGTASELTLTCEQGNRMVTYQLPRLAATGEIPDHQQPGLQPLLTLPPTAVSALGRVAVASGRDDTLPVLTGVLLAAGEDGGIEMAATDRYRLAVQRLPDIEPSAPLDRPLLLPLRAVKRVAAAMRGLSVEVAVDTGSGDDRAVTFTAAGRTLTVRTIPGEYPHYRKLFPREHSHTLIADPADVATAVRQAAVVLRGQPVSLSLRPGTLTVSSSSDTSGGAGTVTVPVDIEGDPVTLAVNPGYFTAGLDCMPSGEPVTVRIVSPIRPLVMSSPARPGFDYLLMPVRMTGAA